LLCFGRPASAGEFFSGDIALQPIRPLSADRLIRRCDPEQFAFKTTEELQDLDVVVGQPRATRAIEFGLGMPRQGYNIYVMGPTGAGRQAVLRLFLEREAAERDVPPDLCYVNNFKEPTHPRLLLLPPGRGRPLATDMDRLVEEVESAIQAAFESEEYQRRREATQREFRERPEKSFSELQAKAQQSNLTMLRTPVGLAFAPVKDGEVLEPEQFKQLSGQEQKRIEEDVERLQAEVSQILRHLPRWERELRERVRNLNREVTTLAVAGLIDDLQDKYSDLPAVAEYLQAVEEDVIDNARAFVPGDDAEPVQPPEAVVTSSVLGPPPRRRYRVNVLVDHSTSSGAPVVYEDNPTYANLLGRIEHVAMLGALVSDYNLIRPGALHRANGGYLILDARKVLVEPYAWEALKRSLKSRQIKIESVAQQLSLVSTVALEPEALAIDVKVALIGDRSLYYLLSQFDPDFLSLFRVTADFDDTAERETESEQVYARLLATLARREGVRPLERTGVARVIEHSARLAGDGAKLSMLTQNISDLLREADYFAAQAGHAAISAQDVQQAIDASIKRQDRLRERFQEAVAVGTTLIDTAGARCGQINGLSVVSLGEFTFGHPHRITARLRLGHGEVVDIEREVELGGPIHSKGVLILSGFLGARYAADRPLSLHASLVFEQSYGGVEGDSASVAELLALLSAIADVPIRQSLAVTGSVNQHGDVQAIGGVNEKVEGFFDVCQARGLDGEQGVLIPSANVRHLMLRQDVVAAAEAGRFHIYAIDTIDQAIELVTGIAAGEPDTEGRYPPDSFNGLVEARLVDLAERRARFAKAGDGNDE
jgi:lon-related putative ATP-dependent protease